MNRILPLSRLIVFFLLTGLFNVLLSDEPTKQAQLAFRAGDFNKVVSLMNTAIEQDKSKPLYFKLRGYARYKLNRFDLAIADYNEAEKLDKAKDETLFNNRGLAYARSGKCLLAIKDFEKALQLKPRYGQAHLNLGNCHDMLGNKPKACLHYKKALTLRYPGAAQSLRRRCR